MSPNPVDRNRLDLIRFHGVNGQRRRRFSAESPRAAWYAESRSRRFARFFARLPSVNFDGVGI